MILNRKLIKQHLIKETYNSILITANTHHKYSAQGKNKMQYEFKKLFFKDVQETKLWTETRIENS